MDIYLLRDGKEFGPFSEETTQSFLKQGTIVMDDLAWTPGLPAWSPLVQILYPARTPSEQTFDLQSEPPITFQHEQPVETAVLRDEPPAGDPPTVKQRAFLSYMGLALPATATKEEAAILVNEAMEDPKLNARVLQWNDDRLRLHPDIFAAELQAKKGDRANRFFDICQHEGADILDGVTKAHCQVLVGYLDVNFPNWDAHEADAPRAYFFPAVAEKFPQLVRKEWHGKLQYPSGLKVAADFGKRRPSTRLHPAPSPVGALVRGAVCGFALLLVLYVGVQIFSGEPEASTPVTPLPTAVKPAVVAPETPSGKIPPPEPAKPVSTADPEPVKAEMVATETISTAPAAPVIPKTHIIVTNPTDVRLRFGTAKISTGTQFKIVSQDARSVTVVYGAETVTIPIENTDLAAPLPAP